MINFLELVVLFNFVNLCFALPFTVAKFELTEFNCRDLSFLNPICALMNNRVYWINNNPEEEWSEALKTCRLHGGFLLVIHNDDEMKAFTQFLLENHSRHSSNFWLGIQVMDFGAESAYYSVGEKVLYRKWSTKEIRYANAKKSCLYLNAVEQQLVIRNENCTVKKAFICQMEEIKEEEKQTQKSQSNYNLQKNDNGNLA